ncbi:MAG: hypothetical protein P1U38_09640 [Aeromicrobium sp.]|uniref:hypothetical protein n=1 Tax=Aeromicrobium sp. TaxID=1871063 RepID=UPI00261C6DE0|nr:hypothetical protein [Aeromicrobium sp.]MDF1705023.1 hypothetical protein [Aeromicrobium sp.]
MWTQSLPSSATEYAREQRLEQQAALAAIRRQWRRMDESFDASWAMIAPTVLAIIDTAQQRVADSADRYIPAVLEETGQTQALAAAGVVNTAAFVGVTGGGAPVADLIALAPIRAKQATQGRWVEESYDATTETYTPRTYVPGKSTAEALSSAGTWLSLTLGTLLSDTGRAVETTGIGVRPVGGWVRMLTPPSCGRCVVLAGRYYRRNKGFERHPGCDCRHIPMAESMAGDYTVNPDEYLNSLDKAGQVKLLGSQANWRAWDEFGADPNQIINAYRRGSLRTAQDRFGNRIRYTVEGDTRRGVGGRAMRGLSTRLDVDAGSVQVDTGYHLVRRMPETIMRTTQSREQVLRQLRLYGWVEDSAAAARGRALIAEQQRIERNARARARRAKARAAASAN